MSKKWRNGDVQPVDEDQGSSGRNASRKLGKDEISNDQACISKPAYDFPIKQQSKSLEKGYHNSRKSLLKKRNHNRGSGVPDKDNDEHSNGKKARLCKNDRKESIGKCGSDDTMKSTRNGADDLRPSVCPTPISYKTNKHNGSFPEVKGSPAESVSSSPMRSSKSDVLASLVRNVVVGDKDRNRDSKCEVKADKRGGSDSEVKPLDSERKRIEDHEYGGKKDFVTKTCGNDEKSVRKGSSSRADQNVDEIRIKKSKALPPSVESLTETPHVSEKLASGPSKVNKASKPSEVVLPANGAKHPSNGRDSFAQGAANAIKEAKDLKHMADRVKIIILPYFLLHSLLSHMCSAAIIAGLFLITTNHLQTSGSNLERTGLYFQAALKFLHGASLLESSFNTSLKCTEKIQSVQTYSSTAKLFE